jgi:4-oxalocrotonate tautomerase family enzyme
MSDETSGLTRRDVIKVGTAASLAGYAVGVEKVLAQAIKTDTAGITAGDAEVAIGSYNMPVYEARPASGGPAPIVVCISEIWGVHEWVRDMTRRFAKAGYYAVAPELFKREGGVAQLPNIQDILKIVLAVPRKQVLGDVAATVDWAKKRPGVRADRAGVTGWCWGGSTVYQVAATNPDMKAGVVWYGPPARPYPDQPNPVTGLRRGQGHQDPHARALRGNRYRPLPRRCPHDVQPAEAGQLRRRARGVPGRGARLHGRLPALVQRHGGRRRLEALHGLVRLVPQGLSDGARGGSMPFVNIRIYEGWGKERKDEIAKRVTGAITDVTGLPKEAVWVVIEEVKPNDWYAAGKPGEPIKK